MIKIFKKLFDTEYKEQGDTILDETYTLIYNYYIKEILYELKRIREDLANVTQGKAIKQGLIKQFIGNKDKINK